MAVAPSAANSSLGTTLQALQSNAGNPLAIAKILQQNQKGTNAGAILQAAQASETQNNKLAMLQALQPVNSSIYTLMMSVEASSLYTAQAALAARQENVDSGSTPDIVDSLIHPTVQSADKASTSQTTSGEGSSSGDTSGILDSLLHPSPGTADQTGGSTVSPGSSDPSDVLDMLLNPSIGTVDLTGMPDALRNLGDAGT